MIFKKGDKCVIVAIGRRDKGFSRDERKNLINREVAFGHYEGQLTNETYDGGFIQCVVFEDGEERGFHRVKLEIKK